MQIHEYELTLIIRPDLEDSDTYAVVEKVEKVIADGEGRILLRDDWGKRKLAYAIRKHLKGHYVLVHFVSTADLIFEVERRMRNEEPIIRFLTVRVGEDVDVQERMEAAEVLRKQREEEARAKAEAEAAAEREAAERAARESDSGSATEATA